MSELSQDVVNKINDLIGLDRSVLSSAESSSELINKLKAKIDSLRDNFIVSMPREYNDESEFGKLCNKIESLSTRYATLKTDHSKIRSLIEDYKKKSSLKEAAGGSSTTEESELRDLIMRTISVQRYLIYIRSLMKLDSFSTRLDSYLSQLESLKEPTSTTNTKSSNQDLLNSNQAKQNRLNEVETLIENLVNLYTEFVDYSNEIIETKCSNLRSYIMDLRRFYFGKIKSILSSEIEKCLKNLSYPVNQNDANATAAVTASNASLSLDGKNEAQIQAANKEKFEHFFKKLAKYILTIESPSFHKLESVTDSNSNSLIKLLIQPLEKRFKFHFCTSRKTNNLDKPEWYLSQILQWIKDENEFINRLVQPMFSEIDYLKDKSAIILFSNGLVNLVGEKLDLDLNNLLKNQMQFSHTIDELILFSNQLDTYLNMTSSSETTKTHRPYTTLHLICEKSALFSHWLGLERQLCEKKLDMLFISLNRLQQTGQGENSLISSKSGGGGSGSGVSSSSPSSMIFNNNEKLIDEIWSCTYSDVDSMKPSQCAETFVLMIKAITDRYYNLPYPSKKLRFVNMQIDLLNEFHMRLCQIIRGEVKNPFSKIYFGALNTVNYLIYILDEWKNSPFFIEMQYYRVKFAQQRKKSQFEATQGDDNDNNDEDSESDAFEEEVSRKFDKEFEIYDAKKNALFEMEGALFDEILPSYEKVKEDMIKTITSNLKWEITSRSRQYKKEKWMAMTSFSEIYKPTLSQSAADMLISLKNLLHLLHESVAKSLFETILKRITTELDKFFYEDVILQAQFNEGGVSQFEFDICRYLMPILSEYANEIKIESYFRKTKESIILLKLKQGSAILLKDVLNKALNESGISGSGGESGSLFSDPATDENRRLLLYNGRNALREFGVIQLSCEEARTLLNLRCDYVDLN